LVFNGGCGSSTALFERKTSLRLVFEGHVNRVFYDGL
jgi:hypothetical protein